MPTTTPLSRVLAVAIAFVLAGCIEPTSLDPTLLRRYQEHVARTGPQARTAGDLTRPVPGTTGPALPTVTDPDTGETLVHLSLDEAVRRALTNNTTIKVVAYDPAVAREDLRIAEGAFDAVTFGTGQFVKTDARTRSDAAAVPFLPDQRETYNLEAGVRKLLATGGEVEVSYTVDRTETFADTLRGRGPAYTNRFAAQLTQPLLRDAGPYVAQSRIRIARLTYDDTLAAFRGEVLDVVAEVQNTYWQLVRARSDLAIIERLLRRSRETLAFVRARQDIDAAREQITDARATLASQRVAVIQARRTIENLEDRLARLMADGSVSILDGDRIIPTTEPATAPVAIDPVDQVALALRYNPALAQARTAIRLQDVNVRVAANQTLPRLDLTAGTAINGAEENWGNSWDEMLGFDFIDYNVGLSFEWPVGNRAAEAALRQARLGRSQRVAVLQDTADQVAVAVREAVRQIDTSYEEMKAAREALGARLANLEALEVRKRYRQALTPDFLNRLLAAQENVALAEQALVQARVNYTTGKVALERTTGTLLETMGVLVTDVEDGTVDLVMDRAVITGRPATAPDADTPDAREGDETSGDEDRTR
ncbi:MAG: TolC family protein [Planctomycetota bacterium]